MVLEYLVANGSDHVIDNIKEHSYHISVIFILHLLCLVKMCLLSLVSLELLFL